MFATTTGDATFFGLFVAAAVAFNFLSHATGTQSQTLTRAYDRELTNMLVLLSSFNSKSRADF